MELFTNIVSKQHTAYKSTDYWGIKVCYMRRKFDYCRDILLESHILPAELINLRFSILKLHRLESEDSIRNIQRMCKPPTVKQNKWTKQLIIRTQKYTKQSKRYLILKSIQKWNKLPFNVRAMDNKTLFKRILTVLARSAWKFSNR